MNEVIVNADGTTTVVGDAGSVSGVSSGSSAKNKYTDRRLTDPRIIITSFANLNLKHELYLAKTVPIDLITGGKKPFGVKRLSDLINFKINIPDLIRHLD